MKRWLLLIPVILLLLLLLPLLLIYLPGVPQLVYQLGRTHLPGELHIQRLEGAFSGPLRVDGVAYQDGELELHLQHMQLKWTPACLLRRTLCVDAIELRGLEVSLPQAPEASDTETDGPLHLPAFTLPLQVRLNQLQATELTLIQGQDRYQLDAFMLALHSQGNRLHLDQLQLQQAHTHLQLQGWLNPADAYALEMTLDWHLDFPSLDQLLGTELADQFNAPMQGRLHLEGNEQSLLGQLQLQGQHLETGALEVNSEIEVQWLNESLWLSPLQINLPEAGAEVQLQGGVTNWREPQLQWSLTWQNLRYPLLASEAQITLPAGQLHLGGTLDAYRLEASTALQSEDFPTAQLRLRGEGSQTGLQPLNLQLTTDQGQLTLSGQLGWQPQLFWSVELRGQDINPALFAADWPGRLQVRLDSEGRLGADGPQLQMRLHELSGQLRDKPLSGQGAIDYRTERLRVEGLRLDYAGALLQLDGEMAEQLAMNFNVQLPQLGQLVPGAGGQITAEGRLSGTAAAPRATARVSGESIRLDSLSLSQLQGDLNLDLSGAQPSQVLLQLDTLQFGHERLDSVELQGQGTPDAHQLALTIAGEALNLNLAAAGRWQGASWRGQLQRLDLHRSELGHWSLASPVEVRLGDPVFALPSLCLLQQGADGQLCVEARRNGSGLLEAQLQLQRLSLRVLDPWLAGAHLESELSLSARYRQAPQAHPSADVQLTTSAGRMVTEGGQLELMLDPINATLQLADDALQLRVTADLEQLQGHLHAQASVRELSRRQLLQGTLDLDFRDLEWVSVFVPELQQLSGQLVGQMQVAGSLSQPQVQGQLRLVDGGAELPAQGIILSPLSFELMATGERSEELRFEGRAGSGGGELNASGRFNLDTMSGEFRLQGDAFEAMSTEIELRISPDLTLNVTPDVIRLGGDVRVPYARITPPRQESAALVRPSADVVLVHEQDVLLTERRLPLLTDVTLTLGDSVRVDAFGFRGRLLGQLRIQDDGVQATRASGSISVEAGEYRIFGQHLTIRRGSLIYTGGPVDNPGLDLRVSRIVDSVEAGARIGGTLRVPELHLFSIPAMPDSSIMSYLVLGRGPGESSAAEQTMMMQAAMALGMQGGNQITTQLRESLSLDELGFDSDDTGQSAFFIGKYLTPRLYVRYGINLMESVEMLTLSYRLTSRWRVETQSSSLGSGADIFWTRER